MEQQGKRKASTGFFCPRYDLEKPRDQSGVNASNSTHDTCSTSRRHSFSAAGGGKSLDRLSPMVSHAAGPRMTVQRYAPVNFPSLMDPLAGPCHMADDPGLMLTASSGCSFSSTASRPVSSSTFGSFTGSLPLTPRTSTGSIAFCQLPPNSLALPPQYNSHPQQCQPSPIQQQQQMCIAPVQGCQPLQCVYEVVPVAGMSPVCSAGPGAAGAAAGCSYNVMPFASPTDGTAGCGSYELVPFASPASGAVMSSPRMGAAGTVLEQELANLLLLQQEEAEVDAAMSDLLSLRQQLSAMHMAAVAQPPAMCQLVPAVPQQQQQQQQQQPLQQQQQLYFVGSPVSMQPIGVTPGVPAQQQQLELQQPYIVPAAAVTPVNPMLAPAQLQQHELLLPAELLRVLAAV